VRDASTCEKLGRVKEPSPENVYRAVHARALPVLDSARPAAPCGVSWEAMLGNGRVRRCAVCSKQVFNVSGMNQADAETLLRERAEGECASFYRRIDKTIITADCPRGLWRRRARELGALAAVALALGLVFFRWRTTGGFLGAPAASDGDVAFETGTPKVAPHPSAKVVNTTAPKVDVDMTAFLRAGCTRSANDTAVVLDYVECSRALPAHVCDVVGTSLVHRDPLLGGLEPHVPIARCSESTWPLKRGEPPRAPSDLARSSGGMSGPTVGLFVIVEDGKLRVLRTRDEFVQRFAPVTTDAEALAFAEALGTGYASFTPMGQDGSTKTPIASVIQGTKVVRTAGGFRVNLFDGSVFGCGTKTTYEEDVTVSPDGAVSSVAGPPLYAWNSGCVD